MPFITLSQASAIPENDTLRVVVPRGITSPLVLLRVLAVGLQFPSGFGENWDALFDCLCDFLWVKSSRVVILHEDLPPLPPLQLEVYLKVLSDAADSWKSDADAHTLEVAFPDSVISAWLADDERAQDD